MRSSMPDLGAILAQKYRVVRALGEGGMGVVVLAVHEPLGARVAMKILSDHGRSRADEKRFLLEAQAAAQLRSEHIARVTDFGVLEDGRQFMVMEHLEGEDLGAYLEGKGTLPSSEAVDLMIQVCAALAEAHAVGIVHRDIKPSNLFLTQRSDGDTVLKVLDFGVSKFEGLGAQPSITSAGLAVGTPLYMSPEQVKSRAIDGRSDVWAVGVVLYELCTGRSPFEDESLGVTLLNVLEKAHPPMKSSAHPIDPLLEATVDACLAKDPAKRPTDVAELAERLAPFATAEGRALATRVRRIFERAVARQHVSLPPPASADRDPGPTRKILTPAGHTASSLQTQPVTNPTAEPSGSVMVVPRRKVPVWLMIAPVAAALLGVALTFLVGRDPRAATQARAVETALAETGAPLPLLQTTPPQVAPTDADAGPASAPTTAATATATAAPPTTARAVERPTASAPPGPSVTATADVAPSASGGRARPTLH